jgi:hypothetical protein
MQNFNLDKVGGARSFLVNQFLHQQIMFTFGRNSCLFVAIVEFQIKVPSDWLKNMAYFDF